jgi:probable HAF family extracellular repeat protein
MIRKILLTTICICLLAASSTLAATATFTALGDLSGGSFSSTAFGVSDDGSTVVGYGTTSSGQQAIRWTKSTGMVSLGNTSGSTFKGNQAWGISADGSTIIGYGGLDSSWSTTQAFRWTSSGGMVTIPFISGTSTGNVGGVSSDGSVIVGASGTQAFRWTASGGTVGLGYLSGKTMSGAYVVSADGSVVVGTSYNTSYANQQAFRWTQSGGMQGLGFLPGDSNGCWADDISPDGSVIVGTSGSTHAFRWTQSTGMVALGSLSGMDVTHPMDVSSSGSTIVGVSYSDVTWDFQAFIWDAAHGMRNLKSVLQSDYGLTIPAGWTLNVAYGVSADGTYIVGAGTDASGNTEGFLVSLPEPATIVQLGLAAAFLGLAGIRQWCRRKAGHAPRA